MSKNKEQKSILSESALLVRVSMSHPSGIKQDKFLKEELAENKNTSANLLSVSKHIFGFDINKHFRSIENNFRNDWYFPMTFPWQDGETVKSSWRLLPVSHLDKFEEKVREAKISWDKEVANFLKAYDRYLINAPQRLGDAYSVADYPTQEEIREKFVFDRDHKQISSYDDTDIRIMGSEKQRKLIADSMKDATEVAQAKLVEHVVNELEDQLNRVQDAMKSYNPNEKGGKYFKDSMLDNLKDKNEKVSTINDLINDDSLSEVTSKVALILASVNSVESLRDKTELGETRREQLSDSIEDAKSDLNRNLINNIFGGGNE